MSEERDKRTVVQHGAVVAFRSELGDACKEFVGRKLPYALDTLRARVEAVLKQWLEHPTPSVLIEKPRVVLVTRMEDDVLHIELIDELGRTVGFDEETGDLVAFDKDGAVAARWSLHIKKEEIDAG
jgi:CBS-domain-containing membrane protein